MRIVKEFEQGSPEWFAARIGNPGASGFDKIITSTGKLSTQRPKYLYQLAGEILVSEKAETFQNGHMQRGVELEQEARAAFSFITGLVVDQCAIVYPDHRDDYHCSPDGFVDDAGLEIKCPSLPVAVEYLDKGVLPTEYKVQVQGSMMVTGLSQWWFCSYYPGLNPLIIKVDRDDKFCSIIRAEVEAFCDDLKELVERLK